MLQSSTCNGEGNPAGPHFMLQATDVHHCSGRQGALVPVLSKVWCATDAPTISWRQTEEEVVLEAPVEEHVRAKNLECNFSARSLYLAVMGRVLVDEPLFAPISPDESSWEIGKRSLHANAFGDIDGSPCETDSCPALIRLSHSLRR